MPVPERAHPAAGDDLEFAPPDDCPIEYIRRTREWYLALGYDNPYVYAHYLDVPFQPLGKPLARSRVTIVTTAAPYQPDKGPQGNGAPYNAAAKFYRVYSGDTARDHDLRIAHVGVDRRHADLDDSGAWFPLPALRAAVRAGRVGELAPRFHGAPTNRSQRHTIDVDAPEILARCQQDGVDAAILVPNCPVCHQTLSLVARHLERHGIATLVMGAAKDIVEHCGVPRFLFSDFPLGNAPPRDPESQAVTLELALKLLESAPGPRTTMQSPLRWSVDGSWKRDYRNLEGLTAADLARLRAENDRDKVVAQALRDAALGAEPIVGAAAAGAARPAVLAPAAAAKTVERAR